MAACVALNGGITVVVTLTTVPLVVLVELMRMGAGGTTTVDGRFAKNVALGNTVALAAAMAASPAATAASSS